MPVIVWIHGGKFFQSSGSTYKYGPDFLLMKDVILVNINYRLGIFGYLNMNVSEAQGNAAMKDKIMALRWVQREIAKFGGDPSRVTIVGGSSGASSVAYLYISPAARGLFHAAVSHSGAAICYWAYLPSTAPYALRVAESLGCPSHDPKETVTCLRSIHGSILAEQQMVVGQTEGLELPFVPSIETYLGEEVFLPDTPQRLISKSGKIPYIIGINNGEGLMYLNGLEDDDIINIKDNITSYLPVHMVKDTNQATVSEISSRIQDFYFGQNDSLNDTYSGFVEFTTDRQFSFCTLKTVEALAARAPVYLYYFTFEGNFQPNHTYSPLNLTGVCHGDELGYFFYRNYTVQAHNNISLYPKDMEMVQKTVQLWTNFATFMNPTPSNQNALNITWKRAKKSANNHLIIGDVLEVAEYSLLKERENLWETLYEILYNQVSFARKKETNVLIYTVMCLLGVFSVILAIIYYIQYRGERISYFKL